MTLEPMDKALQDVSTKYQNIYWRESPASGVRLAESTAQAKLLRVKVREFRIIEDREPDSAMAALWRMPEVTAFLRRNHVHFALQRQSPHIIGRLALQDHLEPRFVGA